VVVTMTNYSDFRDYPATADKLRAIKTELSTARAVVFDLRPTVRPSEEEQGLVSFGFDFSGFTGALTASPLELPSERRRMHVGYVPQDGSTSGDYSSGFYLQGHPAIKPESGGRNISVVFLVGPDSDLPEVALGLQASGRGAIVMEGPANAEDAVSIQTVELPDHIRAQIRLGEMVYANGTGGFKANLAVPASSENGERNPAFQAAMQLAKTGRFSPPSRARLAGNATANRDKTYADILSEVATHGQMALSPQDGDSHRRARSKPS
jgi:hypothetical protein